MKLATASLSLLLLAALAGDVGRVHAGEGPVELCCVCTLCDFSERCFTGLSEDQSQRCAILCGEASCDAGEIQEGACDTFGASCESISAAPPEVQRAPALGSAAFFLAALGAALAGGRRVLRGKS
jgi:hypothetical protein